MTFFQDPAVEPHLPGNLSVLYLLRRDVAALLDRDIAGFPAVMTIMAGIDLLAKLRFGDTGEAGKRFKGFLTTYGRLTEADAESVYGLRCALMHSFALAGKQEQFGVYFSHDDRQPVVQTITTSDGSERRVIAAWSLRDCLENAAAAYRLDLESSGDGDEIRQNFAALYGKYASIWVGP